MKIIDCGYVCAGDTEYTAIHARSCVFYVLNFMNIVCIQLIHAVNSCESLIMLACMA